MVEWPALSMIRTTALVAAAIAVGAFSAGLRGQQPKPDSGPQADPIERIVAAMRAAEQALTSVAIELETRGVYPDGLQFTTRGVAHVLRGEQTKIHTAFEMHFADGLGGRQESAQTGQGVTFYAADAVFGEVHVHVPPAVVRDVEWAGEVLDRSDLPGMKDRRTDAPLGSAMLAELHRHFALAAGERTERGGEAGTWLVGERRPGLGDVEDELPLATRVEAFVRTKDHALLEVVHYQGDKELQRIDVKKLEVGAAIAEAVFAVDGHGQALREVDKYAPLWTQIQEVIKRAEAKLLPKDLEAGAAIPPQCLRPSRR